ncbi:MAG: hypothetical protein IID37_00125 [Planctomycetes bacterium]|nr:hypothetical protein [Planctomycetota bacterium]
MIARTMTHRAAMLMLVLLVPHGCVRPPVASGPTMRTITTAHPGSIDGPWEAAREVLRRQRFEIDRLDRRAGVIVTRPLTSQSAFEFWRHDVDTSYDLLESTLNAIRRRVTVRVAAGQDDGQAEIDVVVIKERLARPERQFSSSTQAYHFFGDSLPGTAGQLRLGPESEYWIELGRDPAMENYLADRIVARCSQPSNDGG